MSTSETPTNEKTKNSIMIAINAFFLTDFIFTSFFTSPVGCEHNIRLTCIAAKAMSG